MWRAVVLLTLILNVQGLVADSSVSLLVFNCRNCHQAQDKNITPLDSLSAQQITTALLDYKYERHRSTVMGRLSKGFSDKEIKAVAEELGKGLE